MPRGGWREAARGKVGPKPKFRPVLSHRTGLIMQMIAWQRYGRPTTDEETAAVLTALIKEEAERIKAAAPTQAECAALLERIARMDETD